ncbi:uncharacterized protein LOC106165464 [Lingula anatina]|uniref:Uncharacterized protein LOC106165464 n=1 Tax=Lingula anatina TaxID=7574 RepID=A0A1S3ILK5_LINAN|nr:uncharacterized protein LOC106165464 [Lingula anatina]|eukprot:XP_013399125.1 uncharacterized protein LOC106165464 [Lingula anatina]
MCSSININSTLPINLTSSRYPSPSVQVHNCSCKVTPPANSVILLEAVDVSMGGSIHFYSRHRAVCRYLAKLTINETKTVSWHGLNYLHTSTYHAACTNLTNYITQFSDAHHLSLEYDSVLNSNSRFWIKLSAYQWVSGDNDDEDFDMHDDNDDDNDHDDDDDDDDNDHDDDDDDDDDDDHHRSRRSHGHHGSRGSHHNIIKRRTWLNVQCQDNHVVSGGPWTDAWTTTTSAPTRGPVSTRGPIPTRPVSTRRPIPRTTAPTRGPTPTTPVSTRGPIPTTPTPTRGPIPTRPVPTSGPILIKPVPTSGPEKLPNPTQGPKIPPIPPEEVPTNPKVQVAGNEKQTDGENTMKETEKLERPGLKHEHILILVGVLAAAFLVMLVVGAFFLYRNCRPSPVVGTIKFNGAYDNAIYQNAVNEKPAKEKETFAYDNVVYAIPSEEKVKL